MKARIVFVMGILLLLISSATNRAHAQSGCSYSMSLPFEWGGLITAEARADCGMRWMSYFRVCIMKESRFSDKEIKCSAMVPLAGYLEETVSQVEAVCQGRGKYYAELRYTRNDSGEEFLFDHFFDAGSPPPNPVSLLPKLYQSARSYYRGDPQERTPSVYMCD